MFKEYFRNLDLKDSKQTKAFKGLKSPRLSEDTDEDPLKVLRDNGIRIKKSVPHKEGYEISLFVDPESLDLRRILRGFDFFVKDSKIFVKF